MRPPRLRCPGGLRRGTLAALLLLAWAAHAGAEDAPLPKGTTPYRAIPPYLPYSLKDAAGVATWCDAAAEQGHRERGTRRGGDLLFAAAEVRRNHLRDVARASALYEAAAEAYPAGDITRAVLLVRRLAHELDRGNAPVATSVLTSLEDYLQLRPPRDLGQAELERWTAWDEERRLQLPLHVARHHTSEGRFRAAGAVRERLATQEAAAIPRTRRLLLLEQAARDYYRAGAREDALRAVDGAIDLTDEEGRGATLRLWRLYAKHGMLSAQAHPAMTGHWPGAPFESDVRAYLRRLGGGPGGSTHYLSLASRAYAAKRFELALEIYLLALRDVGLVEEARRDAAVWRGLLMGYCAAMELEAFDEAERILEMVERIADEPIAEKDAYVVALAKARRWAAERPLRDEARLRLRAAKRARAERKSREGSTRRPGARIETGDEPAQTSSPSPTEPPDDLPLWLVLLAGVSLACAVVGVLVLRRR